MSKKQWPIRLRKEWEGNLVCFVFCMVNTEQH
jgi:hypothetical protein